MNNIITEITSLYNKIQEFSDDYADVKDVFLDDSSVELLGDSISILKFLNNSRKAFAIIKFKNFLKGLNYESADTESVERLINYVDNQIKAEFITSSFDKIISSNSKLACCIMGLMLNEMEKNNRNISQEDLIMLHGLSMLNDFDVRNFYYLYKVVVETYKMRYGITYREICKAAELSNTTAQNIYLTVYMLERYSLIDKDIAVDLDIDKDDLEFSSADFDETYSFNSISQKLYKYSCLLFKE